MKRIIERCLFLMIGIITISTASASIIPPGGSGEPDPAVVKAAIAEFKTLPKKERKERIKTARKEWKKLKKENDMKNKSKVEMAVLIILAILLPPLAVYLHQGEVNGKFWLSILLWFLFILPGVIYALLVVTDSV